MHSNYQYTNAVHLDLIKTLPEGYVPGKVTNITFEAEPSKTSNKMLDIVLSWVPAEDRTCHYNIIMFNGSTLDSKYFGKVSEKRILLVQSKTNFPISRLNNFVPN